MRLDSILVATDLSPASEPALRATQRLREATGARVYVLFVDAFELPAYFGSAETERLLHELRSARRDAVKRVQERVERTLAGPFEVVVVEGSPAETILRTADRVEAGLLVIGTHGRRGLSRLMLGSVADRILRTSSRPVAAVRENRYQLAGASDDLRAAIARILDSESMERAS